MKQELKIIYEDSIKPIGQCLIFPFISSTCFRKDEENPEKYKKYKNLWDSLQPFSGGYSLAINLGLPMMGLINLSQGNMKETLIGMTPLVTNGISALYESYRKAHKKVEQEKKGLENSL
jgi:hypothetical protein